MAAKETEEDPTLSQNTPEADASSRVKRAGRSSMMRLARSLHMLRLGKRSATDVAGTGLSPPPLSLSPETVAKMEEQIPLLMLAYPETYYSDDDEDDSSSSNEGDFYYPYVDNFEDQHFRFRRSEPDVDEGEGQLGYNDDTIDDAEWKRSQMGMLRLGKKSSEGSDNDFAQEKRSFGSHRRPGRGPMGMLRLGKRPMGMLRLGKRPMGMLRLGKRPMGMLRLGKRSMSSLRLGKRQMGMLRLGKRPMGMLRLGKRPMGMLRLGKRPMGMLRLGKRPMGMLRLGKRPMGMLRLGKRSTTIQESPEDAAIA
ncbi:hypothetical protein PoB_001425700 [Plakobranchus ocellatus]|uniref:Uncharacterized protein n=1 Tax=Plakobranchus ocellatus TaxID=259542 RepID=A0AAV3YXM8_9GAST|nr:hypothetical protein PoB_001425700 [Plakobranchus ocellatus]